MHGSEILLDDNKNRFAENKFSEFDNKLVGKKSNKSDEHLNKGGLIDNNSPKGWVGDFARENRENNNERGCELGGLKIKKGFVIMKCEDDFLGTGKASENKIGNFIPKNRRLKYKES